MKCLAIIFNGFEELEAIAPFALLRRAKVELDIASSLTSATGCHNLTLDNLIPLDSIDYSNYDCLILPGGPHYKELECNEQVLTIIKHFMDNNKLTCAICASPTIIGKLGYLKNRNYTLYRYSPLTTAGNIFGWISPSIKLMAYFIHMKVKLHQLHDCWED